MIDADAKAEQAYNEMLLDDAKEELVRLRQFVSWVAVLDDAANARRQLQEIAKAARKLRDGT